jgi:hypothetical protein
MIKTYGGIRGSLTDLDFKYIQDPTRIMWSKSVMPNVAKIVNLISTIPYNSFRYDDDIYFKIVKTIQQMDEDDDDETRLSELHKNKKPTEEKTVVGYSKINMAQTLQREMTKAELMINELIKTKLNEEKRQNKNEISRLLARNNLLTPEQMIKKYKENIISYNFFGGIVYELLNDCYPNVNLHKYADPTSDIDVLVLSNIDIINYFISKTKINLIEYANKDKEYNFTDDRVVYSSEMTLTYQNENGILMINPYTKNVGDFIYDYLLNNLNRLNLHFDNSIPFQDDEYYSISDGARNVDLGYRSNVIEGTNARLISYIDDNLETFRIQFVLKMQIGEMSIVDHFFEFLIGKHKFIENDKSAYMMKLSINNNTYQTSPLNTLFDDNLDAYNKRKNLIIGNVQETRHKGINHVCRIIYLLDLIKNNDNIFNEVVFRPNYSNLLKTAIISRITRYNHDFFIIYFYIDGMNIYKKLETKYIFKAFESFLTSTGKSQTNFIGLELKKFRDSELTEEKMYNILSRFFDLNSSPLRHFIMNSSQYIDLLRIPGSQNADVRGNEIEMYRERINELNNSLKIATTKEEKTEIRTQINKLETEFQKNLPVMNINEYSLKGGRQHRKSQKKYRNKMRIKKYKNTKKRRRRH